MVRGEGEMVSKHSCVSTLSRRTQLIEVAFMRGLEEDMQEISDRSQNAEL